MELPVDLKHYKQKGTRGIRETGNQFGVALLCSKIADQARAWSCCILRNRLQLYMRILVVTSTPSPAMVQCKVCTTPSHCTCKCAEGFAR